MSERSWRIFPANSLGRWSVGLAAAAPLLFLIGFSLSSSLYASVPAGRTIWADLTGRPWLVLTMLTGMASGVSAFITGLLALVKGREKALLVYVSTGLGGLFTLFLAADLAFPH